MCFVMKNGLVFPIYYSDQKFEDSMDLLFLIDDDKSHYMYIKDFNRFMSFTKQRIKAKYTFVGVTYSALVVKTQSVKLEKVNRCTPLPPPPLSLFFIWNNYKLW